MRVTKENFNKHEGKECFMYTIGKFDLIKGILTCASKGLITEQWFIDSPTSYFHGGYTGGEFYVDFNNENCYVFTEPIEAYHFYIKDCKRNLDKKKSELEVLSLEINNLKHELNYAINGLLEYV